VGIRLPQELIVRIDAWGKLSGITRSEAIRRLIEQALPR
jgi:metal-responsive CopG/Arc/MetJ family transcriptional regulator